MGVSACAARIRALSVFHALSLAHACFGGDIVGDSSHSARRAAKAAGRCNTRRHPSPHDFYQSKRVASLARDWPRPLLLRSSRAGALSRELSRPPP
jgi:hypothetical protein